MSQSGLDQGVDHPATSRPPTLLRAAAPPWVAAGLRPPTQLFDDGAGGELATLSRGELEADGWAPSLRIDITGTVTVVE